MNREYLSSISNDNPSEEHKSTHDQPENRAAVNRFKRRFATKPLEELEFILHNNKMVNEARTAAKELIFEKTIND